MESVGKSDYHKMSVAEKERHNRQHAPPTRCPHCDIAVQAADLIAHVASRCPGKPELHPLSRWVKHRQALELGVRRSELHKICSDGRVRTRGEIGQRRYLLVDLAKYVAIRGKRRARGQGKVKAKRYGKPLTKPRQRGHRLTVKKIQDLKTRVEDYVETAGSFSAASRKLDVPIDALKRCAKGESIRDGTKLLIESRLGKVGNE